MKDDMFNFSTAKVKNNYAEFTSSTLTEWLVVESFDNQEFEVFRDTVGSNMVKVGVVKATTDVELAAKLNALVNTQQ